jgi:predicted Zn-ribbon and HTH transcriptional regulator
MICKKCNYDIVIPDLTQDQKRELLTMKKSGQHLQIVQQIQETFKIGLKNSKALMEHINLKYGDCHRCNYTDLIGENIICPKCKSVNTNWKF